MKKIILPFAILLASCSAKQETAEQVATRWCDLHKAVINAKDEKEKDKAESDKKEYEREVESKYKDNEKFLQEVDEKTEACEEESGSDYDGD
jgi:Skp family chaperone for outer membrane proteins